MKAAEAVVIAAVFLLLGRREARLDPRWIGALALSALYVATAAAAVLRGDVGMTSYLVLGLAMGTAALVPWGPWPQAMTAIVAALSLVAVRWFLPEPVRELVYRAIAIGSGLAASVWVAREQELGRLARARVQSEVDASHARLEEEMRVFGALARVGRELIASADEASLLGRACELAAELVGCESAEVVLREADGQVFVPSAFHGHPPDESESLRVLRLPASLLGPLLDTLERRGPMQIRVGEISDPRVRSLYLQYGATCGLYVPFRRGSELVGFLTAHRRGREAAFDHGDERIASGIAYLAALALENARLVEELRNANRVKSEFVSTMSHELRTPVSVILGYADMLAEADSREQRGQILLRVRRSALELLDLIEETLNLNRLEAGKDPPRVEPLEVREIFDELVAEFRAAMATNGVPVRWEGPERVDLRSDRRKLRIVLKNLLGNALKFTPSGEVVVSCRAAANGAEISVRDTGIGIAAEHLPIIFDIFRQADSSDARSHRGAGLGLYIVRRLVTQLGGEVRVESAPGRGSVFSVSLPQPAEP